MPKLNFISDDSVKDKILSWQESINASTPTKPDKTSNTCQEDVKKEVNGDENVTDTKKDTPEDSNQGKTCFLSICILIFG